MNNNIVGESFLVKVIKTEVVHAQQPCNIDHWLPFTNFDLLVPPSNFGFIFFFKKPSNGRCFSTIVDTLKASLSRVLTMYPPMGGEIAWNEGAGENQIHCNNGGVYFVEAVADVELKEVNLYNPDECIEGKLMPKKLLHGVLAIQVTKLKCEGIVIGVMFDHLVLDGYSANMFISSWAEMTRRASATSSMIPSFDRSYLTPRSPIVYSPLINNMFAPFSQTSIPDNHDVTKEVDTCRIVNRIYYIEGEKLKRLQMVANENGCGSSKLVALASFLWKNVALSVESSTRHNEVCKMAIVVDGRRMLRDKDKEKEKLMTSHFGNVLSLPYGSKPLEELRNMSLGSVSKAVQEFLQPVTTESHFLDLIDWVEEQKPQPLLSKAFGNRDMAFTVSAGQRFESLNQVDFGWGKVTFGSCHIPSERKDCYVMTMGSPTNQDDWVVYMHMPLEHISFIEANASHLFKPLKADYIQI